MKIYSDKTDVTKRLIKGFGANSAGKVWVLIVQIISVPSLTAAWGLDAYGIWIMMFSIPSFLALSDIGMGSSASVAMTQSLVNGDKNQALKVYQSAWLFVSLSTIIVALMIIIGGAIAIYFSNIKYASSVNDNDIILSATMLMFSSILTIQMNIKRAIYQSTHKYAIGTTLYDITFLLEGLFIVTVASLEGGFIGAAFAVLLVRLFGYILYSRFILRLEPWCINGFGHVNTLTIKSLLKPSLATVSLTLSGWLSLHGVVLAIGFIISPSVAAIFSTTRMITRIPLQFSMLLSRATVVELTRAQEIGDYLLEKKLLNINMIYFLIATFPLSLFVFAFGPYILNILSLGAMSSDYKIFGLLILVAIVNGIWNIVANKFISINKQYLYSSLVLLIYFLVLSALLIPVVGYIELIFLLLGAEVVIALYLFRLMRLYRLEKNL